MQTQRKWSKGPEYKEQRVYSAYLQSWFKGLKKDISALEWFWVKKVFLCLFLLVQCIVVFPQNVSNLGFGAEGGYRSSPGTSGLVLDYKIKKRAGIYLVYGAERGPISSYSGGFHFYFLQTKLQPCIGLNYSFLPQSHEFSIGSTDSDKSYYKTTQHQFASFSIGGRLLMLTDSPKKKYYGAFSMYLSYRYLIQNENIIFTRGVFSPNREDSILTRTGGGLGIGLRFIWYLNRRGTT
jgi:hypothetical protein